MSVTRKRSWVLLALASVTLLGLARPSEGDGDAARRSTDPRRPASHPSKDCMECHEDMRPLLDAPVPHEPVQDGDCTLCHSPHAARYEKLLNLRERALCSVCHRDAVLGFQKGSVHTPVREGRCTSCHEVHGSTHAGLLVEEGNELCFTCHEDVRARMAWPKAHEPFAEGECSDCHDPHNADHPNQLVAQANTLCSLCHDANEGSMLEAHYDVPVAGTDCRSCHDPHASTTDGLLLPVAHEPFLEGSCEACHMLEAGTPQLVRATGRRLCAACHQDFPRRDERVVHKPVADGDCMSCHLPHASRQGALLPEALEGTCLRCHGEIRERAETSKSSHPTRFEDGQSCDACHRAHTSNEDHLLLTGEIRTCLACHETERHGHPLGEDRVDPRTGKGITCVTCHDPHGTAFSYHLIGERSRGLCLECHDTSTKGADGGRR